MDAHSCYSFYSLVIHNLSFALDQLAVTNREPERNAPRPIAYQATELARNRITPLGGRHQRRLVSRLGLHSKWQQYQMYMYASIWSLRSDRYHYKLQESAKNVCSSTKMLSASGGFAP